MYNIIVNVPTSTGDAAVNMPDNKRLPYYCKRTIVPVCMVPGLGTIPEAVGGLSRLVSLRLDHNNLSGRLPGSLTCLTSLTALDLAHNNITGTVPMKIGTMTTLQKLSLGSNKARAQS